MNDMDFKVTHLLLVATASAVTYYFSHFQPLPAYHVAVAAILLLWSIFSPRKASIAFFVMMIVVDDFPRLYSEALLISMPFTSLFSLNVAGITLYLALAIYFAVINIIIHVEDRKLDARGRFNLSGTPPEITILYSVGALSALIGLANLLHGARYYVSDAGLFINIILGFLIVGNNHRDPERMVTLFLFMMYAVMAKVLLVVLDATVFSRSLALVTLKPGSDSYLAVIIPLFAFGVLLFRKNSASWIKTLLVGMVVVTLAYYLFTASRGRMLVGGLIFIIFLLQIRSDRIIALALLLPVVIAAAQFLVPSEYMSYFAWKSGSFAASEDTGMSSLVRVISLENILSQQIETVYQLLFGTGLGGYFTSQYYPFPNLLGGDAFPDDWIIADKFYKPHGTTLILLLKTGLVGFLVIYGVFLASAARGIKFARRLRVGSINQSAFAMIFIVVSPCIAPFMIINFSSKLQLITGVLIGLSYYSARFLRSSNRTHVAVADGTREEDATSFGYRRSGPGLSIQQQGSLERREPADDE
jgi:hypothetical protein